MKVLTRYFSSQIYRSIAFTLLAFLSLFAFFDLMNELGSVGRGPYQLEHALIYVTLGLPAYAYELMPIVALIGTIFVMAQLAARSEFTVMRASSLSIFDALRLLMRIALVLVVFTFVLGEVVSPRCNDFREQFKRRIQGSLFSAEFRSGLWAKDLIRDPASGQIIGSRFLNANKIESDGSIRDISLFEFDSKMHLVYRASAKRAVFQGDEVWLLSDVDEQKFSAEPIGKDQRQPDAISRRNLPSKQIRSEITPDILSVMLADPKLMSALDLAQYSHHLKKNQQRSEQYDIALWTKLLYPITPLVMMVLALPFAYLQARSGGLSLKVFVGIMIGMGFHLTNSLFSHIGLLNTWPPFVTAVLPSLLFLLAAIAALRWVERH
jgi:lipopolysaccharide export system permease protein